MAEASDSITITSSSLAEEAKVIGDIPYEIFLIIADYAPIEPLLTFRLVSKGVKAFVDETLSDDEWAKRISTVPRGLCAEKVSVHTRLTLACLRSPCCSLCGVKYNARGKGADDIFGVYAHDKCRKKQLFKVRNVASMLNRFLPKGGGSSSSSAKPDDGSTVIQLSTRDVEGFRCKTQELPGYIPGYDGYGGGTYTFNALWMMPHWCTRDSLYDALVARKAEDANDKETVAIIDALMKAQKNEALKADKKKKRAAKKEATEEQRLSEFREHVGHAAYGKIILLVNDLEKTKRSLKRKHGKRDWEWPDEVRNVWNAGASHSGRLVKELDNVKSGRRSYIMKYNYETRESTQIAAGVALPASEWNEYLASATQILDAYNEKYPTADKAKQPPKKKAKTKST